MSRYCQTLHFIFSMLFLFMMTSSCAQKDLQIDSGLGLTATNLVISTGNSSIIVRITETTADLPAGSAETYPPVSPKQHVPVTAEDVKNVEPSAAIRTFDQAGKLLIGLPAETTPDKKDAVKAFYDALVEEFPGSKIFYDEDTESTGQWILYAISPEGKLYCSEVSYEGGRHQFADYPITYDGSGGTWKVSGDYTEVDIPGGEVGVIWKNGFPQFLAGKVTLGSDSYFTDYMIYTTYVDQDPWQKVAGVDELISAPSELYREMTQEEMKARDLYGYGVEVKSEVEGLDTTVYLVTSDQLKAKLAEFGYGPIILNSRMGEITDMDSAQRIGRAVRIADYEGYLQDKSLTEEQYTFDTYIQDLKEGKDRTYVVYFLDEKIIVDPNKEHELVFGYESDSINGSLFRTGPDTQIGCHLNVSGGIRTISLLSLEMIQKFMMKKFTNVSKEKDQWIFPARFNNFLLNQLVYLSFSELAQQGKSIGGDRYYIASYWEIRLLSTPMFNEMNTLIGDLRFDRTQNNNALWVNIVN